MNSKFNDFLGYGAKWQKEDLQKRAAGINIFYFFGVVYGFWIGIPITRVFGVLVGINIFIYLIVVQIVGRTIYTIFLKKGITSILSMLNLSYFAVILQNFLYPYFPLYIIYIASPIIFGCCSLFVVQQQVKKEKYRVNYKSATKFPLLVTFFFLVGIVLAVILSSIFSQAIILIVVIALLIFSAGWFSLGSANFLRCYYIKKYDMDTDSYSKNEKISIVQIVLIVLALVFAVYFISYVNNNYKKEDVEYSQEQIDSKNYKITTVKNDIFFLNFEENAADNTTEKMNLYDSKKNQISSFNVKKDKTKDCLKSKIEFVTKDNEFKIYRFNDMLICNYNRKDYYVVSMCDENDTVQNNLQYYHQLFEKYNDIFIITGYERAFESRDWACIKGCSDILLYENKKDAYDTLTRYADGDFSDDEKRSFSEQKVNLSDVTSFAKEKLKIDYKSIKSNMK